MSVKRTANMKLPAAQTSSRTRQRHKVDIRRDKQLDNRAGQGGRRAVLRVLCNSVAARAVYVGDEFKGKSGMGTYVDCVTEFDYYLGKLFDTLEELGVMDDTIIVFTSDNGPALQALQVTFAAANISHMRAARKYRL